MYRGGYRSDYRNDSGGQKRKNDYNHDYDRSYKRPFGRSYDYHNRRRSPSSSGSSSSIDDEVGHYHGRVGSVIKNRYTIIKELGKGTFGSVFKCKDSKHNDHVALKIIRNIPRYIDSAKIESDILDDVFEKQSSTGVDHCVNMYSRFRHENYYCMVFETLGVSLYDLVKKNNYKRFPLACVRDIARQLLHALGFLQSINLIHTDLKLENVLFTHNTLKNVEVQQSGNTYTVEVPVNTSIKLIDFGGATYGNDKSKSRIVNTRQYRGPEVTLELGWSFPSDMWSAGCILAEVYSGDLLFQTHDELEHLAMMEQALEYFPRHMADKSKHALKFFNRRGHVRREDLPSESRRVVDQLPSLKSFFGLSPEDGSSGIVELVRGMLRIDPAKRLEPQQALELPFVANPTSAAATKEGINTSTTTTITTISNTSVPEVIQPRSSNSSSNGHISDSLNTAT